MTCQRELSSSLTTDGRNGRARLTKERIIAVLKEHEARAKMINSARKHGMSEATISIWKAKFGPG
ncbi:transposase [Bradyrhizobium sp. BWC-3-1]|uniref:transposase n=1 Tax=Bradyrhizobium sp. BWC-3-1 TaxID=3080012 RepID=UPI003978D19B